VLSAAVLTAAQPSSTSHLTYLQAVVIGLIQGVTELFPVSSLGHSVLIPHWIGGSWAVLVGKPSQRDSPYLAFVVVLHVATACALLVFFWREWVLIVKGFGTSVGKRKAETTYERMAWLLILATIPAGIFGLLLTHELQDLFEKPLAAAIFLTINGFILFTGEWLRRRNVRALEAAGKTVDTELSSADNDVAVVAQVRPVDAGWIGTSQVLALFAGISRSGITMVAGLARGLDNEQAVRFAFLLATPIILLAGLLKIPEIFGADGNGIRGEVLAGAIAAFIGALFATKFLTKYFQTRTLTPFGIYCVVVGVASIIRFA
jgi:undecaprenyl-diphosphatase